jgi:hypothetical protein
MSATSNAFDWKTSPLAEVQRRLAELKIIYDRAVSIVASRQAPVAVEWRCWSQSQRKAKNPGGSPVIPASVMAQCHDKIADGRWLFRDDGARGRDGERVSIVCCSQLCFKVYQEWAVNEKLRRTAQ